MKKFENVHRLNKVLLMIDNCCALLIEFEDLNYKDMLISIKEARSTLNKAESLVDIALGKEIERTGFQPFP